MNRPAWRRPPPEAQPREPTSSTSRRTARRLLTTTDLPLGQVARMVAFAEQSALSRAARRWWDATPRQVRAEARAAARAEARARSAVAADALADHPG